MSKAYIDKVCKELQSLFDSIKSEEDGFYKVFKMGNFCTIGNENGPNITCFKHGVRKDLNVSDGKKKTDWFSVSGPVDFEETFNRAVQALVEDLAQE